MTITALLASLPVVGGLVAAYPTLGTALICITAAFTLLYIYLIPYKEYTIPYRNLRGPEPSSIFWGSLKDIIKAPPNALHEEWFRTYGDTVRYRLLLGGQRLTSMDPAFLGYILQHSDDFIKPEMTNKVLERMLGRGLLTAEGSVHRRQRRVMNPAFGPAATRGMEGIFYDTAYELQQKLLGFFDEDNKEETSPTPATPEDLEKGGIKVDVQKYLAQATLDVIGLAGFDYRFNALAEPYNELSEAFRAMFSIGQQVTPMAVLESFFPFLQILPSKRRGLIAASRKRCDEVAEKLVVEKKKMIMEQFNGEIEKGDDVGKDLLSLLMRANMAPDLRADQKMSDAEVIAQITTFMLAGNETSSTALTWVLYRLAQNPKVQQRLREECRGVDDNRPSLAVVEALPYLDKVLHESLRFDMPVPGTVRQAQRDAVIPLSKPVQGRDGKMMDTVSVQKGQDIFLPIMNVNHSTEIWGEDAKEFNPDRFEVGGIPGKSVPGVYGNLLTFLGGARNCIGYRFAIAEIKVIIFVLMRTFSFEELASKPKIEQKSSIVMRPRVVGEEEAGLQMPLIMRTLE